MTKPETAQETVLGVVSCVAALGAGAIIGGRMGMFAAFAVWFSLATGTAALCLWMRRLRRSCC